MSKVTFRFPLTFTYRGCPRNFHMLRGGRKIEASHGPFSSYPQMDDHFAGNSTKTTIILVGAKIEVNMAVWQVQEAKTRLSEVIEEAISKGPQFITRHGSERAVILSVKDYRALTAHKPDLREYLLGGPKVDRFEVPRSRDKGRKVTL